MEGSSYRRSESIGIAGIFGIILSRSPRAKSQNDELMEGLLGKEIDGLLCTLATFKH
jgi:hypothetical protein